MAEQLYYGPLWPLPRAAFGQALTFGLTGRTETTEYYEAAARDVIISAPSSNTGDVYLVMAGPGGTFNKNTDGTVVMSVSPGGSRNIPLASYGGNRYKLADLGIDADEDYDTYFACALME